MTLTTVLAALTNALLIAFVVRRLVAVPVGWPRTIGLALIVGASMNPLLGWLLRAVGIDVDASPQPLAGPLVLVTVLAIAWLLVFEVIVLAVLEVIVPTGSLPSPLAFLRDLPARRRRAQRYAHIVRIASKHGLGPFLRRGRASGQQVATTEQVARSLRLALTDAGVCFVKLGQMLSTRADLLSPAFVDELSQLQSNVPPQPWAVVKPVIEAELGRPVDEVFASISPEPLAAASLAQVHAATLPDGSEVVVKVQRHGAEEQVLADLDIITRLAAWLDARMGWARALGVRDLAQGFAGSLHEELDYRVELANRDALAATVASAPSAQDPDAIAVRVPDVHRELCTSRVMVVEKVTGKPVTDVDLSEFADDKRASLAEALFASVLHQVIGTGVFHADLHPGNIFFDGEGFTLLDFGAVGRLDRAARQSIGVLLLAIERQEASTAADALVEILDRPDALDDRRLERDLGELLARQVGASGTADLIAGLFRLLLAHRFRVPPQVAAAFRALGALEGSLVAIQPGIDLIALARQEGQSLAKSHLTLPALRSEFEAQAGTLLPLLQRLPRRLDHVVARLEAGRLIEVNALQAPATRAYLTGLVEQLAVSGLAAAVAFCGVFMIVADSGPMMAPELRTWTYLGFVLLLFGFVLAARVLVVTFTERTEATN